MGWPGTKLRPCCDRPTSNNLSNDTVPYVYWTLWYKHTSIRNLCSPTCKTKSFKVFVIAWSNWRVGKFYWFRLDVPVIPCGFPGTPKQTVWSLLEKPRRQGSFVMKLWLQNTKREWLQLCRRIARVQIPYNFHKIIGFCLNYGQELPLRIW
jgi:hypothetical protein